MQPKAEPDSVIPELLVVEKPRLIRLIMSEKHSLILKQITQQERSISEIARALGLNPGSVHYYLKELEKHGLARQVRQEIKGGIVKKYYRAAARRFVLASPDFEDPAFRQLDSDDELSEQCLRLIELLGYHIPEENREDAKELLLRFDRLFKSQVKELQELEASSGAPAGPPFNPVYPFLIHLKTLETPELGRILSQFQKLFLKVE